jgi:predicted ATPase/class 3 adenylate cyclase
VESQDRHAKPPIDSSRLPTGTVTFLFTDIEGSTQRWERHGDDMRTSVPKHDEILRGAVEARRGYVFKTVGDSCCATFWTAPDAAAAAIEAQRALASQDWSSVGGLFVRMAIHTGTADERDGDYFGPAVNRVARLLAVAHGGQILLSETAAGLSEFQLPTGAMLRDLGHHRLRDLANAEHVFQLVSDGLPDQFAALRSVDAFPNNLPLQLTSFVGQREVIEEVGSLLERARLVTLVGSGGIGKTRTAIEIGAELLDRFTDGVWLIELASLASPDLIARAFSDAMRIREIPDRSLIDSVISWLEAKDLLLIVDNCEHVIDTVAKEIGAILRTCPSVKVLATSREALRIAGEHAYRVPSLSFPDASTHVSGEGALAYASIALFVERARANDDRFALTVDNLPAVVDICRRLDGIALAIELAAARISLFSPRQLSNRLSERFRVLDVGARDAIPRQRTLRALIDWSYDLLSPNERTLFRRLGVFAGGWSLDGASEVCADDSVDPDAILDLMSGLVAKSLVLSVGEIRGTSRFRLLESTHEYAIVRLEESGESDAIARKHAEFVRHFAQRAEAAWHNVPEAEWLATVSADIENVWAALDWSLARENDVALGAEIATSLHFLWLSRFYREGTHWLEFARERVEKLDPALAARVLLEAAGVQWLAEKRVELAESAVQAYRGGRDLSGFCGALQSLGQSLINCGRLEDARVALDEALAIERTTNKEPSAKTLTYLGFVSLETGELATASELFGKAEIAARRENRLRDRAIATCGLGEVALLSGDVSRAIECTARAVAQIQGLGDPRLWSWALVRLAHCYLTAGDLAEARAKSLDALTLAWESHFTPMVAESIVIIAAIAQRSGDGASAARLIGHAETWAPMIPISLSAFIRKTAVDLRLSLKAEADPTALERLLAEGKHLSTEEIVAAARGVAGASA